MRMIRSDRDKPYIDGVPLRSRPDIPLRGWQAGGWPITYPYAAWKEQDWLRFIDIAWIHRVNLVLLSLLLEILPVPLSAEDCVCSGNPENHIASGESLGVLSLGHSQSNAFTPEHLRLGNSLAIPAAAAIQNARLYERASLYGSELEKRVYALDAASKALALAEEDRKMSEEKFHRVFHSSPLPFSITTADEGRFVDINPAFEVCYGYSRAQLIGHTVHELRIWENPSDPQFDDHLFAPWRPHPQRDNPFAHKIGRNQVNRLFG